MRCLITILCASFLFRSGFASGQSFTISGNVAENTSRYGFSYSDSTDRIRFRASHETIVGFYVTGGGIIIGGVGLVIYKVNSGGSTTRSNTLVREGTATWLVGGIVAILGSVFSVDGGIRDVRWYRYKEEKLTLYSSGKNQLGIAYNF